MRSKLAKVYSEKIPTYFYVLLKLFKKLFLNDYMYCFIFVAVLLFGTIQLFSLNHELMDPFTEAIEDFEVTDIGFSKLRESDADTNIVLINLGNADNSEIALLLNQIAKAEPAVVGINKFFRRTGNGFEDSLLAVALKNMKNCVLVSKLTQYNPKTEKYEGIETSDSLFWIERDEFGERYLPMGFKNMPTTEKDFKTTRKFMPYAYTTDYEDHFFPVEIIKYKDSSIANKHIRRKNNLEIINYRGNLDKFFTIDTQDWMEGSFEPSVLKNKVVILGYLGESIYNKAFWDQGKFYTPMNQKFAGKTFPDMYETVIFANVASMILADTHVDVVPWHYNLLINLVICFHVIVIFSMLFHAAAVWWDVFSIIISFLIAVGSQFITVLLFTKYSIEIDLNFAFLFSVVSSSFLELYYGLFKIAVQKLGVKYKIIREDEKRQKLNEMLKGSAKDLLNQGLTDFDFKSIADKNKPDNS